MDKSLPTDATESLHDRLVKRSDEIAKANPIDTFDDYTGRLLLEAAAAVKELEIVKLSRDENLDEIERLRAYIAYVQQYFHVPSIQAWENRNR